MPIFHKRRDPHTFQLLFAHGILILETLLDLKQYKTFCPRSRKLLHTSPSFPAGSLSSLFPCQYSTYRHTGFSLWKFMWLTTTKRFAIVLKDYCILVPIFHFLAAFKVCETTIAIFGSFLHVSFCFFLFLRSHVRIILSTFLGIVPNQEVKPEKNFKKNCVLYIWWSSVYL